MHKFSYLTSLWIQISLFARILNVLFRSMKRSFMKNVVVNSLFPLSTAAFQIHNGRVFYDLVVKTVVVMEFNWKRSTSSFVPSCIFYICIQHFLSISRLMHSQVGIQYFQHPFQFFPSKLAGQCDIYFHFYKFSLMNETLFHEKALQHKHDIKHDSPLWNLKHDIEKLWGHVKQGCLSVLFRTAVFQTSSSSRRHTCRCDKRKRQ